MPAVAVMLPELVTLAKPVSAEIPNGTPRDAGAGIVGHRRVGAGVNATPAAVMLPELVTLAKPVVATIPFRPPVMLAPALLVTVALVSASMPKPAVPVMLPELVTLAKPVVAKIP